MLFLRYFFLEYVLFGPHKCIPEFLGCLMVLLVLCMLINSSPTGSGICNMKKYFPLCCVQYF